MSRNGKALRLGEHQVVESVGISVTELRIWCEAGWVAPAAELDAGDAADGAAGGAAGGGTGAGGRPVFDDVDVARVQLVRQLRDDLGLDAEFIPVVLSLVDQLYGVRRELRALAQAVEQQDQSVVARIRDAYCTLAGRADRGR